MVRKQGKLLARHLQDYPKLHGKGAVGEGGGGGGGDVAAGEGEGGGRIG